MTIHLIPQPVSFALQPGTVTLTPKMVIAAQDEAVDTALLLAVWLGKPTGFALPV